MKHDIRKRLGGVHTDQLRETFKDTKLVFGKRQSMNLKRLLTSSAFSSLSAEPRQRELHTTKTNDANFAGRAF